MVLQMRFPALMLLIGVAIAADGNRPVTDGLGAASENLVTAHVVIASPLTTVIPLSAHQPPGVALDLSLDISAACGPLGLGIWRTDVHGRWFQYLLPGMLMPGQHQRKVVLDGLTGLVPGLAGGAWTPTSAAECTGLGLYLFGTGHAGGTVDVAARMAPAPPPAVPGAPHLVDLTCDASSTNTGRRWSLSVRPRPYPADPFDPTIFRLELVVTAPDNSEKRYAGFHDQPMGRSDRGDREVFTAYGEPSFCVRFRPQQAGRHQLRLEAHWQDGSERSVRLPDLEAQGKAWDDIVRVDAKDPRFFSAGGAFVWPLGHNLNSTYDVRSQHRLGTKLTPDRGSFVRETLLERLAINQGNAAEVWLSPWNLALEWIPRWPGFQGTGRYHEGNAWALDQLLDQAERAGMRLNLVLYNHGMARAGNDAEDDWRWHPYNKAQGGWLDHPAQLFSDARARVQQERYFHYLAARFGDSPAVLGWKLWAEVNLAHVADDERRAWHIWATEAMRRNDPWQHPVTTHWCGDWAVVDKVIAAQPGISYLTIDAYHGDDTAVADLLATSMGGSRLSLPRRQGLGGFNKPIVVTEYGGSSGGCSQVRMEAEHALGPWVGLATGHAAAPMLWWFEWIDQGHRYAPFRAVSAFLIGEDLRGSEAWGHALEVLHPSVPLWCRAWLRPGRSLGYVLDRGWGKNGGNGQAISGATLRLGSEVAAGTMRLQWWDADRGVILADQTLTHTGGRLQLAPPEFRRHLAFKLWRVNQSRADLSGGTEGLKE